MNAEMERIEESILESQFGLMCLNLTQTGARIMHTAEGPKTIITSIYDIDVLRMLQLWLLSIDEVKSKIIVQDDHGIYPERVYPYVYALIIACDLQDLSFNVWMACSMKVVPDWIYRNYYDTWLIYYNRKWGIEPPEAVGSFFPQDDPTFEEVYEDIQSSDEIASR